MPSKMSPAPSTERCRCGAQLDTDALHCSACRTTTNSKQTQRYSELRAAGKCTWCGVQATTKPAGGLDQFCRKHRIARNKYLRDRKTAREKKAARK